MVNCKCNLSCSSLRLEYKIRLFENFNDLASYDKQQAYLRKLNHPQYIRRRRHGTYDHPGQSRRQHTFDYYLILPKGCEVRVFLKLFCNTFRITPHRVQILYENILAGIMDHSDKRGGSRNTQNMQEWKDKIREYISSFLSEIRRYLNTYLQI